MLTSTIGSYCLNEMLLSYSMVSTTMHVKYMYVKYVIYSLLGLLDRCTCMGKGMGFVYALHMYMKDEYMNML